MANYFLSTCKIVSCQLNGCKNKKFASWQDFYNHLEHTHKIKHIPHAVRAKGSEAAPRTSAHGRTAVNVNCCSAIISAGNADTGKRKLYVNEVV